MAQLTDEERRAVAATPLFGSLPAADLNTLLQACDVIAPARGQMVFTRGEPAVASYLVLRGRVKLVRTDETGAEAILRIFGPGDTFAEAASFMGGRYPASAYALDPCRLLRLRTGPLEAEIQRRPELAMAMLASMAAHLKALVEQIADLKLMTADQRVAWFLVKKAREAEDGKTLRFPYGRAVLASELGMTAETFSRALRRLSRFGVTVDGDEVTIGDLAAIARHAGVR
jgi:CRP-like cAMP-binding protein